VAATSVRRWLTIITVTVVGTYAVFWGAIYPRSGAYHQAANMAMAERGLTRVAEMLAAEPRWANIRAAVHPGQYGSLALAGHVASDGDLCRLMRAVAERQLSVPVNW
jgi:hypothetical protein